MKRILPYLLGLFVLASLGCGDVVGTGGGNCDLTGSSLSATINGQFWCSNSFLTANLINNQIVIEGASGAEFLTLRIFDYNVEGTYTTDGTFNTISYNSNILGAFESTDFSPGQLIITEHDADENILKGNIDATLISGLGENVLLSGQFDVIYIE